MVARSLDDLAELVVDTKKAVPNKMKTVRRLFFSDILSSVSFVALAFLSLFFFIDFVQEMGDLSAQGPASELASDPRVIETYLGTARKSA